MERPLIPAQLKGNLEAQLPGYWNFWQRFQNWTASLFDTSTNALRPPHMADAVAPNDSVYYSTTASRLVYKDSLGAVHNLW